MGRFDTTKATINANIKKNGNQEITGSILNSVMTEMVDSTDAQLTELDNRLSETESSVSGLLEHIASIEENDAEQSAQLTELSERIDNLPEGEEFDAEGNYPSLRVGTADTAIDLAGRGESVPASFGFRASGGKSIKDGRAYIKRIKGNSVVWNQWAKSFEYAEEKPYQTEMVYGKNNSVTITNWTSYNPVRWNTKLSEANGHKFLALFDYENTDSTQLIYVEFGGESSINVRVGHVAMFKTINVNFDNLYKDFFTLYLADSRDNTITISNLRLIDLTKMFQAGNEPTTIEEFNARVATLGVDMYAYNEGQVIHCNTESIKSVGDNAWDEQWRQGYFIEGTFRESSSQIASANPIKVLPNQEYYINQDTLFYWWFYDEDMQYVGYTYTFGGVFKVPANAKYMHFSGEPDYGTTYKNDIMIRLDHSGWKSDIGVGYEPYWQDTLPLPIIQKYFPDGMKKAGSAHDEIRYNKASGKWEYSRGKIKSVDMGTLNWDMAIAEQGYNVFLTATFIAKYDNEGLNIINKKYTPAIVWMDSIKDKQCRLFPAGEGVMLYVRDTDYTDVESFKASLQGVMLYYESNDWEWVELDAEDQNFRDYYQVADFGTEQSQSNVPSAPFSADIIYQFNAVDMIREHEAEITELQKVIATMQAQLASLTNS